MSPAICGLLAAILVVLGLGMMGQRGFSAEASPDLAVGVDLDPAGTPANTATSLGSIERYRSVAIGDTFNVDIWVTDIVNVKGWQTTVIYNASVLNLIAIDDDELQGSNPESNVLSLSDSVPDADGEYLAAAVDLGSPDSGTGRLATLTFRVVAPGYGSISLGKIILANPVGESMGDSDGDGFYDGETEGGAASVEPSPVGGIAEFPDVAEGHMGKSEQMADGSNWWVRSYIALAGMGAAGATVFAAGAWYGRKRRLR